MPKVFSFCEVCGDILMPYAEKQGEYHKKCYDSAFVCHDCCREIVPNETKTIGAAGEAYCSGCSKLATIAYCSICRHRIPQDELWERGGNKYHVACYRREYACGECGKDILDSEVKEYDIEGSARHSTCFRETISVKKKLAEINKFGGKLTEMFREDKKLCKAEEVVDRAATEERAMKIVLTKKDWDKVLRVLMFPKPDDK